MWGAYRYMHRSIYICANTYIRVQTWCIQSLMWGAACESAFDVQVTYMSEQDTNTCGIFGRYTVSTPAEATYILLIRHTYTLTYAFRVKPAPVHRLLASTKTTCICKDPCIWGVVTGGTQPAPVPKPVIFGSRSVYIEDTCICGKCLDIS